MNKLTYCLALFLLLCACAPVKKPPMPPDSVPKEKEDLNTFQNPTENPPQAPVEKRPLLSADKALLYINSSAEAGTLTLYITTPLKGRTLLNAEELKKRGYRLHIYTPLGIFTQHNGSSLLVSARNDNKDPIAPDAKITITLRNWQGDIFQTLSIPVRDGEIIYQ